MSRSARVYFRNEDFDGQFVRTLAAAPTHASDLGEAFAAATRVKRWSAEAWHDTWLVAARTAEGAARASRSHGDDTSARHAYLRASEYYRQSYYFLRSDLTGDRLRESHQRHLATFGEALALMDHPAELVHIPYDETTVKGYFFSPDDEKKRARATILFPCGYDSTAEAGWVNVPAALERGYNVLVFEGPGQGSALLNQGLHFREDFESVLSPVLDWVHRRGDVDRSRVVLVGRSFAGYLAPRAAAFEDRLAALVVDPAQPDMGTRLPRGLLARVAGPLVRLQTRLSKQRAEFFGARMAGHGLSSVTDYFAELRRFTMLERAQDITCPTLIIEAEGDFAGGNGAVLRDAMTAPATLVHLTAESGASGHCGGLGQEQWAQVVYGWLAVTLAGRDASATTSG